MGMRDVLVEMEVEFGWVMIVVEVVILGLVLQGAVLGIIGGISDEFEKMDWLNLLGIVCADEGCGNDV
ncbi:hypothetical protein C5167_031265 [Papaver somniferum]|nr:hypothetical protein C5167_031265 [Papaver somniferum]